MDIIEAALAVIAVSMLAFVFIFIAIMTIRGE